MIKLRNLFEKKTIPAVRLMPTPEELDNAKLPSKWRITLYEGGDKKAEFDDIRDVETADFSVSFDDAEGFGHEFYGFEYRLDEYV